MLLRPLLVALTPLLLAGCAELRVEEEGVPITVAPRAVVTLQLPVGATPGNPLNPSPQDCLSQEVTVTPAASPTRGLTVAPGPSATPEASLGRLPQAPFAPTPAPFVARPFVPDLELERSIRARLTDAGAAYSVFVKDLRSGRGAAINDDAVYYSASVFKLYMLYEVFRQRALGLLEFSDRLPISPYYASFALTPTRTEACQEVSIAYALEAMLAESDNTAAILLQDRTGAGNISRSLQTLGLRDSHLLNEDLPLSARDAALLLEAIYSGAGLRSDDPAQMLGLMTLEIFDNGLRAGTPAEAMVAHKTGLWSNAVHEAGIVFAESGPYIIVVLSDGGDAGGRIDEVAAAVYEYLKRES